MASGKFTIDDAFQSDDDDPIRLYGSTTDSVPLRGKRRPSDSDSRAERQSNREVVGLFTFFWHCPTHRLTGMLLTLVAMIITNYVSFITIIHS